MTDRQILEEVYRRLKENVQDRAIYRRCDITNFIEQEWQRQDEDEKPKTYKMPDGYSVDQGGALDVKEIERHRGLEIGPDGTVTNIL